jgi:hypothetical protein
MIKKWKLIEETANEDNVLVDSADYEEIMTALSMLREQYPHATYRVEDYMFSNVKPGFGRDPDLH